MEKGKPRYYLGIEGDQPFILCYSCNQKSFHPEDIKQRYCVTCHKFHDKDPAVLKLWTIYRHPSDHRGKYVARLWLLDKPTDIIYIEDTLDEIRKTIPPGLVCMPRDESDDPVIVETWL